MKRSVNLLKRSNEILFLTNSNNCMSQRLALELKDMGHKVTIHLAISPEEMLSSVEYLNPDIILCPFLTKKLPEKIYSNKQRPCVIVHPGIKGDRGISSLDWAIRSKSNEWGVTLIQAHEKMDAGAIWASKNFYLPKGMSKSSTYRTKVVESAVTALGDFLEKYEKGIAPEELDYNKPDVKGKYNPMMTDKQRSFSWDEPLDNIVQKILYSDSLPGAKSNINGKEFRVFGPKIYEMNKNEKEDYKKYLPGRIIGKNDDALLIKTSDSERLLWISHLKKDDYIKLPASFYITDDIPNIYESNLIIEGIPKIFQEVYCNIIDKVAFLNFNFLNGAMNTNQCRRLEKAIIEISKRKDVDIIVLRGSEEFFSNGINLNTIEAANDPSQESLNNINAINDCVKAIFSIKDKITVSYFEGNAGAGGVMMALSCDYVLSKAGVVLNPHYKGMGLYGSEYWTYFLHQRVGNSKALDLTESQYPVLARNTLSYGLVDDIIYDDKQFQEKIIYLQRKKNHYIQTKIKQRNDEWFRTLENHRNMELAKMKENFNHRDYHRARKNFVYKIEPVGNFSPGLFNDIPMPKYIDCKKLVDFTIKNNILPKTNEIKEKFNVYPKIAILQVGDIAESNTYVEKKKKTFSENNFLVDHIKIEETKSNLEEEILFQLKKNNEDPTVTGIILQLPIPKSLNPLKILENINPIKDIDGFHMMNFSRLALERYYPDESVLPATVKGIIDLLEFYDIKIQGKDITVIGKGITVGLPLTLLFMSRGATVISCDVQTKNLAGKVANADIVVCAANVSQIIDAEIFNEKSFVIDVGNNVKLMKRNKDGKIIKKIMGNVKLEEWKAGHITPVPGGVGSLTVISAMVNCLDSFFKLQSLNV